MTEALLDAVAETLAEVEVKTLPILKPRQHFMLWLTR